MIRKSLVPGNTESAFQVRLLPAGEVRLALPIAQLLYPALTEEIWVAYVNGGSGPEASLPRRILVAHNSGGYLHGLCTLSDGFDLSCGRTLDVDDFVVANFLDAKSVAQALLTGVDEMARKGGYHAVRVSLADGNLPHRQAVADALNREGHLRTTACYCKPLAQPSRPIAGA